MTRRSGDSPALDTPVQASLTGAHAHLGRYAGRAWRYDAAVSPFAALPLDATEPDWTDLASLLGPDEVAVLWGGPDVAPPGWTQTFTLPLVQMVAGPTVARADEESVRLGAADVPDMLDLVARTQPGPFGERTVEMGTYLGLRHDGALVAMAGERMHPPGHTEVSAVCTDPAWRGHGLGGRLVRAVAAGVVARGETPFLHAAATNVDAVRLYEKLGFTHRRTIPIAGWRRPPG